MLLLTVALINVSIYLLFAVYYKLTIGISKCSRHLVGKVVIVTGGNNGIGFETAKDMAERGAKVIIGCRSEERGLAARDQIIASTENKNIHYKKLDLSSFKSVREFADDVLKNETRLDILINNAGMHGTENKNTEDGLLLDMQTNHFGPFLLTNLLLPLLKKSAPSRIVNVASLAYAFGEIDFDNLNAEKVYHSSKVYSATKLCNVLMAVEMAKRLKGTGVTINALHPGAVRTKILNDIPFIKHFWTFFTLTTKSAWEGAQTTIHLAVSPDVKDVSGKYFTDCQERNTLSKAQDVELARKLWEVSEKIVKHKVN